MFKKGDRVKTKDTIAGSFWGKEGTVNGLLYPGYIVHIDDSPNTSLYFGANELTLVETLDKQTVIDVLTKHNNKGALADLGLVNLPTKAGSVIVTDQDVLMFKLHDYSSSTEKTWVSIYDGYYTNEYVAETYVRTVFEPED